MLVKITSRAWAFPILASLHRGVPGRQAPLLKATRASRTAFAQSVAHLIEVGVLERNPGHGHPLRPEFRLTEPGRDAAALAHEVLSVVPVEDQDLLRRSWTMPVLCTVNRPRYFNDIKRMLLPITDRALSQSLKMLEERGWVQRSVDVDSRPPRPLYEAVNEGLVISRVLSCDDPS